MTLLEMSALYAESAPPCGGGSASCGRRRGS